jgi:hypothetical protein
MPEDVQQVAEPHADTTVRYERRDAQVWMAAAFAAILVAGAVTAHLVVYAMLAGLERRQRADEARAMPLPEIARENRPRFPAQLDVIRKQHGTPPLQVADLDEMKAQRDAEDAMLKSYGWSDKAKGTVRIPIEQALKLLQDPATAKAHGIIARDMREVK